MNLLSTVVTSRRRQRGSALMEMAFALPILVTLLTVPLFFAQLFWFYSVAQKSAHDAARFLSTATQAELRTIGASGGEAQVAGVARWIAATESDILQPVVTPLWIYVQCGTSSGTGAYIAYGNCGDGVPQTVRVQLTMRFKDLIFPGATYEYFGEDGLRLGADVTMRYAGK